MNRRFFAGSMLGLGLVLAGAAAGQDRPRETPGRPPETLRRVQRGEPLEPCPQAREEGRIARERRGNGFTVDACGRKVSGSGELLTSSAQGGPLKQAPIAAAQVTIDRMTTSYSSSHSTGGPIILTGSAATYELNDGSQWSSGAGSFTLHSAQLDHVEVSGTTLRYVLSAPASGLIYQQTDYNFSDHSAQGTLGAAGPLVLEAESGSTTAVLRGKALVVANDATWYGEPRFNYYTAIVGAVVPFEMVYTKQGGAWTADSFSQSFSYSVSGFVDFEHPVSSPRAVDLSITGPSRVPDEFTTTFTATVLYETGVKRNVSTTADWTVDPAALATIADGVLTTGTLQTPEALLTLQAEIVVGADHLVAEKQVSCLADDPAEKPGTWPMFQANARHTGYLPISIDPTTFSLRWQRDLGGGMPLNPVAAGDGKVFATLVTYFDDVPTLFALRIQDGAVLWSKGFGGIFSVNPPSYAYGNVYVQTGNHGTDTWLRAYEGDTGASLFQAPHAAQWERYFAPTIYEGKAYINGGYYGGVYGFDAYTGDELWFAALPQYDEWTPAVDAGRVYEYVEDLYAQVRSTGDPDLSVYDPGFEWNGWSMELAPVLGAHDDVIVINNGRLISFDTALETIRWQVQSQFAGQPSVAQDRIYALDGGRLRVLDELTHAEIWSWQAPDGNLVGPMIVTDTHVFVSTGGSVHAVDLATRQSVWSYPVGGHLAIADGTLYVASQSGKLSAFSTPPPLSFYTVAPCRVVDTRGGAPVGGPPLAGGTARVLHLAGQCGVPATAKAVSVNVTVTGPGASGHLTLGGAGGAMPVTSTVNYSAGQTRANNAILPLDPAGDLAALATQAKGTSVHLIIDVNGYFE